MGVAKVQLPGRVWIVGPTGSGKSTLGTRLARGTGVEATHLDELHWLPGWVERADEAMDADLAPIVARDRWIIEGGYGSHRRRHLDRIQLTVWLDLPLRVTLVRLIRRGVRRSLRKETCCNGNQETLRQTFFRRDSLLLWAVTTARRRRRELKKELATRPHVCLRSQRDVDRWLTDVGG